MLVVGRAIKAHGIRGDIKAEVFTDTPDSFSRMQEVFIGGKSYCVEKVGRNGSFALIKLVGIDDMNAAETFRGMEFFVERQNMPPAPDGRVYICDLIGCSVTDGTTELGVIYDILQCGGADVICAKSAQKKFSFPWVASLNATVDVIAKKFTVDGNKFFEVVLYED